MARRRFSRPLGERRYKKLFVLEAERAETEPRYFKMFEGDGSVVHVHPLKGKTQSAPLQVLKRMNDYLGLRDILLFCFKHHLPFPSR